VRRVRDLDDVDGIAEEFDGAVATFSERADLLTLVEHYLADSEERHLLGERGRAVVVARHTFAARVREIEEAADDLLRGRPSRILPPPPD
jgi:spore maturation protein CgeB